MVTLNIQKHLSHFKYRIPSRAGKTVNGPIKGARLWSRSFQVLRISVGHFSSTVTDIGATAPRGWLSFYMTTVIKHHL